MAKYQVVISETAERSLREFVVFIKKRIAHCFDQSSERVVEIN